MESSSQILGLLLAAINTATTGRNPIAPAYYPALGTASALTNPLQTLIPSGVLTMLQPTFQALFPNAVPGMIPGVLPNVNPSAQLTSGAPFDVHPVEAPGVKTLAVPVFSPAQVLSPTTESTPSTVTIKVIVRHDKACKRDHPGLTCVHRDDHRLTVPFPNLERSFRERREMDMPPGAFDKAHFLDGVEEAC